MASVEKVMSEAVAAPRVPTSFRRWRDQLGLSQAEAAEKLGLSLSSVQKYDCGQLVPAYSTRLAMRLLADGGAALPWPE